MEIEKFKITFLGNSRDLKTNEWSFLCKKCNNRHTPATTLFSKQKIECPKCGEIEIVDYNKL